MTLALLGINPHRLLFTSVADALSAGDDRLHLLRALQMSPVIEEAALVMSQKCVEIYCVVQEGSDAIDTISRTLAEVTKFSAPDVVGASYFAEEDDALGHVLALACDSDYFSLVDATRRGLALEQRDSRSFHHRESHHFHSHGTGEKERVFTQALGEARSAGSLGEVLFHVLDRSRVLAVQCREQATPTGAARAAVTRALAGRVFDRLSSRTVLLLGANDAALEMSQALAQAGVANFAVIGDDNPARKAAETLGGRFGAPEALAVGLAKADIVIVAASDLARQADTRAWRRALRARRGRSSLVIDLTEEKAIESKVATIDALYLYRAVDLDELVEASPQPTPLEEGTEAALAKEHAALGLWLAGR